jgi:hypothetical protein
MRAGSRPFYGLDALAFDEADELFLVHLPSISVLLVLASFTRSIASLGWGGAAPTLLLLLLLLVAVLVPPVGRLPRAAAATAAAFP